MTAYRQQPPIATTNDLNAPDRTGQVKSANPKPTGGLFIMAATTLLNPKFSEAEIESEIAEDPGSRHEWLGEFCADAEQAFPDELIDRAIVKNRLELPFQLRRPHVAFADTATGVHKDRDAMCLAIAHAEVGTVARVEGTRLILDRLVIEAPPFQPEATTQRLCEVARSFGITKVMGDRFGGAWVADAFARYGLRYEACELDKSAIYREALAFFAADRVELLDIPRLITELRMLERRPRSGGRGDSIDHPGRNAHDDAANAACGALWMASKRSAVAVAGYGRPRQLYALGSPYSP
jgi:hypothetical protein